MLKFTFEFLYEHTNGYDVIVCNCPIKFELELKQSSQKNNTVEGCWICLYKIVFIYQILYLMGFQNTHYQLEELSDEEGNKCWISAVIMNKYVINISMAH